MAVAVAPPAPVSVSNRVRWSLARCACVLVAAATTSTAVAQPSPERSLALVGVHVIDVVTGTVLRDRTVIVRGGEIVSLSPTATFTLTGSVRVHAMRGKYVIPGLWDMVRREGADTSTAATPMLAGVTHTQRAAGPVTGLPALSHANVLGGPPARHDEWLRGVRAMIASGTPLVAASGIADAGSAGTLADELEALVKEADLSPLQALQAATCNPARAQTGIRSGLVEPGYRADLVVLERNPLARIGDVRRVHAVVRGGQLFDRLALDSIRNVGR